MSEAQTDTFEFGEFKVLRESRLIEFPDDMSGAMRREKDLSFLAQVPLTTDDIRVQLNEGIKDTKRRIAAAVIAKMQSLLDDKPAPEPDPVEPAPQPDRLALAATILGGILAAPDSTIDIDHARIGEQRIKVALTLADNLIAIAAEPSSEQVAENTHEATKLVERFEAAVRAHERRADVRALAREGVIAQYRAAKDALLSALGV